jgi:hypothetical protein
VIDPTLREVVDFLHDRIAEDQEAARALAARNGMHGYSSPACEIKRRMIADVLALPQPKTEEWVLHMLANDYRGHPEWRTEWNGWRR